MGKNKKKRLRESTEDSQGPGEASCPADNHDHSDSETHDVEQAETKNTAAANGDVDTGGVITANVDTTDIITSDLDPNVRILLKSLDLGENTKSLDTTTQRSVEQHDGDFLSQSAHGDILSRPLRAESDVQTVLSTVSTEKKFHSPCSRSSTVIFDDQSVQSITLGVSMDRKSKPLTDDWQYLSKSTDGRSDARKSQRSVRLSPKSGKKYPAEFEAEYKKLFPEEEQSSPDETKTWSKTKQNKREFLGEFLGCSYNVTVERGTPIAACIIILTKVPARQQKEWASFFVTLWLFIFLVIGTYGTYGPLSGITIPFVLLILILFPWFHRRVIDPILCLLIEKNHWCTTNVFLGKEKCAEVLENMKQNAKSQYSDKIEKLRDKVRDWHNKKAFYFLKGKACCTKMNQVTTGCIVDPLKVSVKPIVDQKIETSRRWFQRKFPGVYVRISTMRSGEAMRPCKELFRRLVWFWEEVVVHCTVQLWHNVIVELWSVARKHTLGACEQVRKQWSRSFSFESRNSDNNRDNVSDNDTYHKSYDGPPFLRRDNTYDETLQYIGIWLLHFLGELAMIWCIIMGLIESFAKFWFKIQMYDVTAESPIIEKVREPSSESDNLSSWFFSNQTTTSTTSTTPPPGMFSMVSNVFLPFGSQTFGSSQTTTTTTTTTEMTFEMPILLEMQCEGFCYFYRSYWYLLSKSVFYIWLSLIFYKNRVVFTEICETWRESAKRMEERWVPISVREKESEVKKITSPTDDVVPKVQKHWDAINNVRDISCRARSIAGYCLLRIQICVAMFNERRNRAQVRVSNRNSMQEMQDTRSPLEETKDNLQRTQDNLEKTATIELIEDPVEAADSKKYDTIETAEISKEAILESMNEPKKRREFRNEPPANKMTLKSTFLRSLFIYPWLQNLGPVTWPKETYPKRVYIDSEHIGHLHYWKKALTKRRKERNLPEINDEIWIGPYYLETILSVLLPSSLYNSTIFRKIIIVICDLLLPLCFLLAAMQHIWNFSIVLVDQLYSDPVFKMLFELLPELLKNTFIWITYVISTIIHFIWSQIYQIYNLISSIMGAIGFTGNFLNDYMVLPIYSIVVEGSIVGSILSPIIGIVVNGFGYIYGGFVWILNGWLLICKSSVSWLGINIWPFFKALDELLTLGRARWNSITTTFKSIMILPNRVFPAVFEVLFSTVQILVSSIGSVSSLFINLLFGNVTTSFGDLNLITVIFQPIGLIINIITDLWNYGLKLFFIGVYDNLLCPIWQIVILIGKAMAEFGNFVFQKLKFLIVLIENSGLYTSISSQLKQISPEYILNLLNSKLVWTNSETIQSGKGAGWWKHIGVYCSDMYTRNRARFFGNDKETSLDRVQDIQHESGTETSPEKSMLLDTPPPRSPINGIVNLSKLKKDGESSITAAVGETPMTSKETPLQLPQSVPQRGTLLCKTEILTANEDNSKDLMKVEEAFGIVGSPFSVSEGLLSSKENLLVGRSSKDNLVRKDNFTRGKKDASQNEKISESQLPLAAKLFQDGVSSVMQGLSSTSMVKRLNRSMCLGKSTTLGSGAIIKKDMDNIIESVIDENTSLGISNTIAGVLSRPSLDGGPQSTETQSSSASDEDESSMDYQKLSRLDPGDRERWIQAAVDRRIDEMITRVRTETGEHGHVFQHVKSDSLQHRISENVNIPDCVTPEEGLAQALHYPKLYAQGAIYHAQESICVEHLTGVEHQIFMQSLLANKELMSLVEYVNQHRQNSVQNWHSTSGTYGEQPQNHSMGTHPPIDANSVGLRSNPYDSSSSVNDKNLEQKIAERTPEQKIAVETIEEVHSRQYSVEHKNSRQNIVEHNNSRQHSAEQHLKSQSSSQEYSSSTEHLSTGFPTNYNRGCGNLDEESENFEEISPLALPPADVDTATSFCVTTPAGLSVQNSTIVNQDSATTNINENAISRGITPGDENATAENTQPVFGSDLLPSSITADDDPSTRPRSSTETVVITDRTRVEKKGNLSKGERARFHSKDSEEVHHDNDDMGERVLLKGLQNKDE